MGKSFGIAVWAGVSLSCFSLLGCAMEPNRAVVSREAQSSSKYLLHELASTPSLLPAVDFQTMVNQLATADVAMIGESHEIGLERQVLADVYGALFERIASPKRCLVETYANLLGSATDPVKPLFDRFCPADRVFDNSTWDYTAELARSLERPGKGIVLTHTGYRHELPLAKFYPESFDPNSFVDLGAHGSLTLQLPSSFSSNKLHARSFAPLALDMLLARWIGRELTQGVKPAALERQLDPLWDSLAPRLVGTGKFRAFELKRVSAQIPHHQAFIGILQPEGLNREELRALLRSSELAEFLKKVPAKSVRYHYLRGGPSAVVQIGSLALNTTGVFFLSGTNPAASGETLYLIVDSTLRVRLHTATQ